MFGAKKKSVSYDAEKYEPVIKCSICTGEQVAGFKDKHTGKFEEVMLIKERHDLEYFMMTYDLKKVPEKEY